MNAGFWYTHSLPQRKKEHGLIRFKSSVTDDNNQQVHRTFH